MTKFVKSVSFRALWMNIIGFLVITTLCVLDGLVIFAVYSECDLMTEGLITTNDQVTISSLSFTTTNLFMAAILKYESIADSSCPGKKGQSAYMEKVISGCNQLSACVYLPVFLRLFNHFRSNKIHWLL